MVGEHQEPMEAGNPGFIMVSLCVCGFSSVSSLRDTYIKIERWKLTQGWCFPGQLQSSGMEESG